MGLYLCTGAVCLLQHGVVHQTALAGVLILYYNVNATSIAYDHYTDIYPLINIPSIYLIYQLLPAVFLPFPMWFLLPSVRHHRIIHTALHDILHEYIGNPCFGVRGYHGIEPTGRSTPWFNFR